MNKFLLALIILHIKITKKYRPLIVSWPITYKCNKKCKYCVVHKRKENELDTKQCLMLINALKKKGTRILTITGGEPTLRKDLPIILRYARSRGLSLFLNTNGTGLNKELASLVDRVSLSLDGPESTNDYIRGKGTYKKILSAIQVCKENNVPVSLTFVINRKNNNKIKDILRIGRAHKLNITFQPMMNQQEGESTNHELLPTNKGMQRAVNYLIEQKKKGEYVGNSINALKHFLTYPAGNHNGCIAGKIYLRLSPEGNISFCGSHDLKHKIRIDKADNNRLKSLLNKPTCKQCWCANLVELNKVYNLELGAMLNAFNYTK